ncbi:MAG: cytochrome c biogenesis heme-transporting ATPase CcmA [Gammaproteobacteria bacterium]|nr:cytochrome c biogenesis heme-transporting ATPase CcmA [Gammaproteobacteria bacterium]
MFSVTALTCQLHDVALFSALYFTLQPGECLQITGHNGCGKTTLLRTLAGLREPDSGEICWQRQSIHTLAQYYAQQRLYLGHKPGLRPELTAIENLLLLQTLSTRAHTHPNPMLTLSALGLEKQAQLPTHLLSVGQQKRLRFTQLLQSPAPFWILDEPFAGLDQPGIHWLQEKIQNHLQQAGVVIFTSHQKIDFSTRTLALSL